MTRGIAVVAGAVGGIREMISDRQDGFLVMDHSAEAFADTILALSRDASLVSSAGLMARRTVAERFSLAACAEHYAELYSETSRRHSGGLRPTSGA